MAQHRALTDGGHGRQEPSTLGQLAVADGIDATVHRVEPADADPVADGRRREADGAELARRDDAVLPVGELGKPDVRTCLTLRAIIDPNVKHSRRVARRGARGTPGLRRKWS